MERPSVVTLARAARGRSVPRRQSRPFGHPPETSLPTSALHSTRSRPRSSRPKVPPPEGSRDVALPRAAARPRRNTSPTRVALAVVQVDHPDARVVRIRDDPPRATAVLPQVAGDRDQPQCPVAVVVQRDRRPFPGGRVDHRGDDRVGVAVRVPAQGHACAGRRDPSQDGLRTHPRTLAYRRPRQSGDATHRRRHGLALVYGQGPSSSPARGVPDGDSGALARADAADPRRSARTAGGLLRFRCFADPVRRRPHRPCRRRHRPADDTAAAWAPTPVACRVAGGGRHRAGRDVHAVVLTHLTPTTSAGRVVDGAPYFPNARSSLQRAEADAIRTSGRPPARTRSPTHRAAASSPRRGDPGRPAPDAVATPGHTPGTSAPARQRHGPGALTGDLLVHVRTTGRPDAPVRARDGSVTAARVANETARPSGPLTSPRPISERLHTAGK